MSSRLPLESEPNAPFKMRLSFGGIVLLTWQALANYSQIEQIVSNQDLERRSLDLLSRKNGGDLTYCYGPGGSICTEHIAVKDKCDDKSKFYSEQWWKCICKLSEEASPIATGIVSG